MRPLVLCAALLALAASGCGKRAEPDVPRSTDGTFPPGSGVPIELTPFQGKWTVAKLEVPDGGNSPAVGPVDDASREKIAVTVTGSLLKLDLSANGGGIRHLVLALIPQRSPRELDLTDSDEEGDTGPRTLATNKGGKAVEVPRERYAAIYMFNGDTTIIALPLDPRAKRPTEFKPALVPVAGGKAQVPVVVVHLKKKQ